MNPKSAELDELFRRDLISRNGAFFLDHGEELKRFQFYLETLETFISTEEKSELDSLGAQAAEIPDTHRGEFWAWYSPVHWDEIFRTNLRSSLLVSLVSFLEYHLGHACKEVQIIARTPVSFGDLKGSIVERAQLFLTAFGQFELPTPDQWGLVKQIYDVRNVFVHHAGFLFTYNHRNRLRQSIHALTGLQEDGELLSLSADFCPFVLSTLQTFLDGVDAERTALCERVRRFEGL